MKRSMALAMCAALAAYGGSLSAQDPGPPTAPTAAPQGAPPTPGAPGPGRGAGRGGRGGAPVPTLGDGPWDITTEQALIHLVVVTKGLRSEERRVGKECRSRRA